MNRCFFETDRIRLRALEPEDLELLYNLENDSSLWHTTHTTAPYSNYVLRQYIESNSADLFVDKQLRLVIELKKGQIAIGMIDLFDFSPMNLRAEVGVIVASEYQQQGFAKEAVEAMVSYALGYVKLHQLYAYVSEENKASIALFTSCGFEVKARLVDWVYTPVGFCDALILQKLNTL